MLERKFDKPRNIGERSSILAALISSGRNGLSAKPGSKIFISQGIIKKAMTLTATITMKKPEKIESINFLPLSASFSNLSMKNGTSTDAETIDAIDTKMRSGILNAA
jgi:hypothetical protein